MLVEITTAARYWAQQLQLSQPTALSVLPLEPSQVSVFESALMAVLQERYASHWYESNPIKGQAYRSILADFENGLIDDVLLLAASRAHISDLASHLPRQNGLRMWCDPGEVSVEPIRGRARELVLYRARSGRRAATAASSKASAAATAGSLSASAAPFQSRRSPPLVAAAAPFNTRGLYTAADHERLATAATDDASHQQLYYNTHALSTPAIYDASSSSSGAWASDAAAAAAMYHHHHRHASTGGGVGLYHHHHQHAQKQLAAF